MQTIKNLSAYYYIGLVVGYFKKQDIIKWADSVLEKSSNFPYEIIEVSLSSNKSIEDTASILKKICGEESIVEPLPLFKLLGHLVIGLENNRLTDDEFFTYILKIHQQRSTFLIKHDLSHLLDYLSDGYYLATEGIHGDVETIKAEAIEELCKYKTYVSFFEDISLC